MADHGYQDWHGNDLHFTGGPWSGRKFDPIIAGQAIDWLHTHATKDTPWFLTVALVNPHDIMWYPIDHLSYQETNPKDAEAFKFMRDVVLKGVELTAPPEDYPQRFDQLPQNFQDDLHTKPEVQRAWREVRNKEHFVGDMSVADHTSWLRQLDYYAWLHEQLDESLGSILGCLEELDIYDSTCIAYTSDHGDACGSHGLRAKLPCVYEEVMGVPLVIKPATGTTAIGTTEAGATAAVTIAKAYPFAGQRTDALATHVDLAATLCSVGGCDLGDTLAGKDLSPVLDDPAAEVRDWVFFSQDSAQSELISNCRYAVRGFFDGTTKYARYYGVGGGIRRDGSRDESGKRFDTDARFDDHDHEWYNLTEDPLELFNLAHDRGVRTELQQLFEQLLEIENQALA